MLSLFGGSLSPSRRRKAGESQGALISASGMRREAAVLLCLGWCAGALRNADLASD